MNKQLLNQYAQKWLKLIKPWAFYIAIFLVLRYSGVLSSISYYAQSAIMKTGVMNATPNEATNDPTEFDYNFSVTDLKNTKIDFNTFKGKTIFLNVWATWCGPCRVEMPSIQNLYTKIDSDKIAFVMLAVDHVDPFNKVTNFVTTKEYTFPVYLPTQSLPQVLQVGSIPTTFIINKEGKIVQKKTGAANYDTEKFKKFLEGL